MSSKWDGLRDEDWNMLLDAFAEHGEKQAYESTANLRKCVGEIDFAVGADIAQRLLMKYYGLGDKK